MSKCNICGNNFDEAEFKMFPICDDCKKLSKRSKAETTVKRELLELGKLEQYTDAELEREINFAMKTIPNSSR